MFKKTSHTKLIILSSLLPIVSFGVVVLVAYQGVIGSIDDEKWVKHTHDVIEKTDSLFISLLDVETGSRGYVITGKENFLEPYDSGLQRISDELSELKKSTTDNPIQQENIGHLATLIDAKLTIQRETIDLRKNHEFDAAMKKVDNNEGKIVMDQIRQVILDIKNEENSLLKQRSELSQSSYQNIFNTTIIGILLAILISGISTFVIYRKMKQREQLENANLELQIEREKLKGIDAVKDEFSAMVTHELKTPLVPILGYCKMFKTSMFGQQNKEQAEAIEVIERSAKRLENLITDIMDARKLDIDKMRFGLEDVSLNEFFEAIDSSYKKILKEKGIEYITNLQIKDLVIQTDRVRLRQVFDNLINNSIKFVPENNGIIEVGAFKKDDSLVLYVKDNGSGIPKEKQKELFKKYYQVDTSERRPIGGTGLGLAISKGITEKLGGHISVESDGKNGTTLYLKFPLLVNIRFSKSY